MSLCILIMHAQQNCIYTTGSDRQMGIKNNGTNREPNIICKIIPNDVLKGKLKFNIFGRDNITNCPKENGNLYAIYNKERKKEKKMKNIWNLNGSLTHTHTHKVIF